MNSKILNIDIKNYDYVINNNKNNFIIIDFYAEWCLPCKKMSEIFNSLSNDNDFNNILFCKVNIDNNEDLVNKYNIKTIPTFIILYSNKIINKKNGLLNYKEFKEFINKSISNIK